MSDVAPWLFHRWGRVWLVDQLHLHTEATAEVLPRVTTERAQRFVRPDDAHLYLHTHRALHRVLSAILAPRNPSSMWQVGAHGKPMLDGGPAFNLSRRRPWAVFIIGNDDTTALGVDIEPVRMVPDAEALARTHFTPSEHLHVMQGTPMQRSHAFLRVWTRKEAAVKAVGLGLSIAPSTFEVGVHDDVTTTTLESATHRYRVEVESLAHEQVVLAVARVVTVDER